jgi:hydrophobic/amphiphilic exporter-1 (mainly G- bacteria), HAE1 family
MTEHAPPPGLDVASQRGLAIPAFSLRRPVTVGVLFLAMLVLGAIAYRSIGVELIPSGFTPPFLYVEVPTLRSSPADVEQRIALPLEEMLATVRNVDTLGTRVRGNAASFMMEFADGTDMDVAYNQVRDRIDRVIPTLGDDLGQYFIWKYNPADDAVLWFAVGVDDTVDNPGWTVDHLIIPAFERIPGVSRIEAYGVPSRVVSLQVDERLVEAAGTSMVALIERLSQDNFAVSAGVVEDGSRTWPLRMVARYESLEEIRALPIGNGLRLGDIAVVEVQDRAERALYRIDGRSSIMLGAYKESTANTVDVARAVRRVATEELAADPRLDGVGFAFLFDQGAMIEGSIENLQQTAVYGGAFAVAILFFFLRRLGMTLLVTLAIPCSLLVTVVFMYFTGRSLNLFSLTGLMLAVGMVVDNAIVVVESIQARLLAGDTPRRAALYGAAEVSLAILVATLTTVVVFLPLIFMSGGETLSFYLANIGLPVCVSLLASLVVSLVFLPLATTFVLTNEPPPRVRSVDAISRAYVAVLRWAMSHRFEAWVIALVAFASVAIPMGTVTQTDQSEPNINDVRFILTVPDQYSWEEKVEIVLAYESALEAERETLGIEHLQVRMSSDRSRPQVRAFLKDPEERTLSRDEIIERATEVLPEFPAVTWSLRWGGTGAADAITVRVTGPDSQRLSELSEEVVRRLRLLDGVTSVQAEGGDTGQSEVQFRVDPERSLRLGLNAMTIGGTIDFALRGRRLPSYHGGGEELPMLIEGDLDRVDELDEIQHMPMPSLVESVVLGDVTASQLQPGYGSIDRQDRRTVSSITIVTSRDDLEVLRSEIMQVMEGFDWPRGYGLELGDRFADLESGAQDRLFALMLAVVSVFLLMGVLFESITLPFSILLSIPFAFTGVYWMLYLTDTQLDMMAGVGLVILIGIVVNNAIVLVDRISELRRQGVDRTEAILEAGSSRLRPIVMTALTTIAGLIPMAVGSSSLIGIPYNPLGRAVIGGLLASTVLTLVVVPLFYALIDDMRKGALAWWRGTAPRA